MRSNLDSDNYRKSLPAGKNHEAHSCHVDLYLFDKLNGEDKHSENGAEG